MFLGVQEPMLLAPCGVCCFGCFGDFLVGVREDEPQVQIGMLLLNKDLLLPIGCQKAAFGLDDQGSSSLRPIRAVGNPEVRCVLRGPLWVGVGELVLFEVKADPKRSEFRCKSLFKT